ncbi:hypothetical protein MMC30_006274 [Trapelia coarctata]|nr:hypothetical protein [Trapelia coarctata]
MSFLKILCVSEPTKSTKGHSRSPAHRSGSSRGDSEGREHSQSSDRQESSGSSRRHHPRRHGRDPSDRTTPKIETVGESDEERSGYEGRDLSNSNSKALVVASKQVVSTKKPPAVHSSTTRYKEQLAIEEPYLTSSCSSSGRHKPHTERQIEDSKPMKSERSLMVSSRGKGDVEKYKSDEDPNPERRLVVSKGGKQVVKSTKSGKDREPERSLVVSESNPSTVAKNISVSGNAPEEDPYADEGHISGRIEERLDRTPEVSEEEDVSEDEEGDQEKQGREDDDDDNEKHAGENEVEMHVAKPAPTQKVAAPPATAQRTPAKYYTLGTASVAHSQGEYMRPPMKVVNKAFGYDGIPME